MGDDQEILRSHTLADFLVRAFYKQGDTEYLEKVLKSDPDQSAARTAKSLLDATTRIVDRTWCPYLDEHGICIKGTRAKPCDPISYAGGSVLGNVVITPRSYDYSGCPTYLSSSQF